MDPFSWRRIPGLELQSGRSYERDDAFAVVMVTLGNPRGWDTLRLYEETVDLLRHLMSYMDTRIRIPIHPPPPPWLLSPVALLLVRSRHTADSAAPSLREGGGYRYRPDKRRGLK